MVEPRALPWHAPNPAHGRFRRVVDRSGLPRALAGRDRREKLVQRGLTPLQGSSSGEAESPRPMFAPAHRLCRGVPSFNGLSKFVEDGWDVLGVVEDTNHLDGTLYRSVEDGEWKLGKDSPAYIAVCRVRRRPKPTEGGKPREPMKNVLELMEKTIPCFGSLVVEVGSMLAHILLRPGFDEEVEGHACLRAFFARSRRRRASSARRSSHQAALTGTEGPEASPSAKSAST